MSRVSARQGSGPGERILPGEAGTPAGGGTFGCRRAHLASLSVIIGMLLVAETAGLHLLLFSLGHPVAGWSLTLLSVTALGWLVADYRDLGGAGVRVEAERLDLRIGRRISAVLPRDALASVVAPTWRDLQAPGQGYLNGTKPATPNVLLAFHEPVTVTLMGVVNRPVRRIGLCLDDPERFLALLAPPLPGGAEPSPRQGRPAEG